MIQQYVPKTKEIRYYCRDFYNIKGRKQPQFVIDVALAEKDFDISTAQNLIGCWKRSAKFNDFKLDLDNISIIKISTHKSIYQLEDEDDERV